MFRLPHDTPADHIGAFRFVSAMSFMGLASYLAVGLFSAEKPQGVVWRYVEAYANPNFEGGVDRLGPFLEHGRTKLKYALDFERAFEFAIAENKPVFLDFTGVNCANCRFMEKGPMSQPQIEERLKQFVRIQLFTDNIPDMPDRAEAERLREFNARLQEQWYGDVSLPSYVVIPPDREVLKLKGRSKILSSLAGKNDEVTFAEFLDRGLAGWKKIQAQKNAPVVGKR
jgi:thiol:disulfide interchange protein DsbD